MARVKRAFQFRLSLAEVRPTVSRRIQVPAEYTLARLHEVIQAVMGWQDYHLHEFTVGGQLYGDPDLDEENQVVRTTHTSGKLSQRGLKSIGRLTENAK